MNELVNIIITTYDDGSGRRHRLFYETLWSLLQKLRYDNVHYIITDDSEPDISNWGMDEARRIFASMDISYTILNTNRMGVGFAKNNALKLAFETSDLIFMLEDDWFLGEPLDLTRHVEVLREHPENSVIRFGYLGGTIDASYVDYGLYKYYWQLHRGSGVYIYSGQISLRTKKFYNGIGWHLEGVSPGEEELDMCKRFNACETCGDILWPGEYATTLNAGPFINIGLATSTNAVKP